MSRRVQCPVQVACDPGSRPLCLTLSGASVPVLGVVSHWREWFGVGEGEPERDVWRVETPRGVCELHCLRHPTEAEPEPASGSWLLWAWED